MKNEEFRMASVLARREILERIQLRRTQTSRVYMQWSAAVPGSRFLFAFGD